MVDLNDTQIQILDIVAHNLFKTPLELTNVDWADVKREAMDQAVFPLVFESVMKMLPHDIFPEWFTLNNKIIKINVDVHYTHSEVHSVLNAKSCPYVALKGSGSAYYYPNPIKRMMGDVDFLVPDE